MRSSRTIIIIALAALCTSIAWSQSAPTGVSVESIRPGQITRESITQNIKTSDILFSDPNLRKYDLDMSGIVAGMSLKRGFNEERIEAKGNPLDLALRQKETTEGAFSLSGRTKLTFSLQSEAVRNLREELLTGVSTNTFGLEQGFGAGVSAGSLGFSRSVVANNGLNQADSSLVTQTLDFKTGFRQGLTMASSFTTKEATWGTGLSGQEYNTSWALPFSGGAGALSFGKSDYSGRDTTQTGSNMHFAAPIAFMGNKLTLERGYSSLVTNGVDARDEVNKIALPFKLSGGAANFAYSNVLTDKPGLNQLTRNLEFAAPLRFAGQTVEFKRHSASDIKNGVEVLDEAQNFLLPFKLTGGMASFQVSRTEVKNKDLSQTVDKLDFVAPLMLAGYKLDLQRHVNSTVKNGVRTDEASDRYALPFKMSGGDALVAFTSTSTAKPDVVQDANQIDMSLPFAFQRSRYVLERHDFDATRNNSAVHDLVTKIAGPVPFISNKAALADYTVQNHTEGGSDAETRTAHLATPLSLLGRTLTTDYTNITLDQGTSRQEQDITKIAAPLAGQTLNVDHRIISKLDASAAESVQKITQVTTPKFMLLEQKADISARMQRTENVGVYTQKVTGIDVHTQPIAPLSVQGSFETRDMGPEDVTRSQQLTSTFKMADRVALNAKYLQTEALNHAPTIQRGVNLESAPKSGVGLAMKAAVVSWTGEGKTPDSRRRLDAKLSSSRKLALQAYYTEYDSKDNNLLALDQPTVGVALQAGDPSRFAMQLKYNDQTGRPEQERGVAFQLPALGGALQVGYTENPLDPTGKIVRVATVYDAALERQLFGNVKLNFGYRYCNYEKTLDNHFASFQLAGGNENGGGQIKLGYLTGDFVPVTQGQVTPESTLDLTYSRKWGNDGRFGLSVRRVAPPIGTAGDATAEGRLEYQTKF